MLLLLLALAVSIAACGDSDSDSSSSASDSTSASASDVSQALPSAIQESGTIKVGTSEYPPYSFKDQDSGEVVGFETEIGSAMAEKLGVEWELDLVTDFSTLLTGLQASRYDIVMGGMADTQERQQEVSFVNYLYNGLGIVLAEGNPKDVATVSDLCGQSLGYPAGTPTTTTDQINKICNEAGKDEVDLVELPGTNSLLPAIESSRIDAYIDSAPVAFYAKENGAKIDVVGTDELGTIMLGIAVPKADTELQDALLTALKEIQDDGTYDQILKKWGLTELANEAGINTGDTTTLWAG